MYVWVAVAVPEPLASVTVAADDVPSPQAIEAVCVSWTPGSEKGAVAVMRVPTGTGASGATIGPQLGGRLPTVTWNVPVSDAPAASSTRTVTV